MNIASLRSRPLRTRSLVISTAVLVGLSLGIIIIVLAHASTPLGSTTGYLDFSYGIGTPNDMTGEKPESKLWWNDGFWWGSLFNPDLNQYHIYRLNWGTQTWEDTGVPLDDRIDTKADVLWDEANNKLYVASHIFHPNSSSVKEDINKGKLFRYSYNAATQTYTSDGGFPVNVNNDKTESLVFDKDPTNRLWVTYVSRDIDVDPNEYKVYVNASTGSDTSWGEPFPLTDVFTQAAVAQDDISSLISFRDDTTNYVGVMWSNQITDTLGLYFATHPVTETDFTQNWNLFGISLPSSASADDHISLKSLRKTTTGQVFAVVKSNATTSGDPLIVLVVRQGDGTFVKREYSTVADDDTRPIVLIDEGNIGSGTDDKAYVFVTDKPGGKRVCYKSVSIAPSVGTFASGDCGIPFIEDLAFGTYLNIDNATTTKQNTNDTTGIVVLASDDSQDVYVHNVLGNPPPVITSRSPDFNETGVAPGAVVTATFSRDIDDSTLTNSSFKVEDGGAQVVGSISYDTGSRTATFTPSSPLDPNTAYDVTVTNAVKATSAAGGKALFETETWSFTTGLPEVNFSQPTYDVNESALTATITVTLDAPVNATTSVDYATSDVTAQAGSDYTSTVGTLTFDPEQTIGTISVPIINDAFVEGDETLNVVLSDPVGLDLGTIVSATLTITDDDTLPTVQFDSANYDVLEDGVTATLTVTLSHSSPITTSVDYATSDVTAQAGSDYTSTVGTLTFDPEQTIGIISVPIINDAFVEGDETLMVTLSSPVGLDPGSPISATLTIKDDDSQPTVQFDSANYDVLEDGATATLTVTLSHSSPITTTVDYATSDVTAQAGSDYTSTFGTLTFDPGQTVGTISVPIMDDSLFEGDETLNVSLSDPMDLDLGTPTSATLTILEDDHAIYLPLITRND
jgi:hypothetical protein